MRSAWNTYASGLLIWASLYSWAAADKNKPATPNALPARPPVANAGGDNANKNTSPPPVIKNFNPPNNVPNRPVNVPNNPPAKPVEPKFTPRNNPPANNNANNNVNKNNNPNNNAGGSPFSSKVFTPPANKNNRPDNAGPPAASKVFTPPVDKPAIRVDNLPGLPGVNPAIKNPPPQNVFNGIKDNKTKVDSNPNSNPVADTPKHNSPPSFIQRNLNNLPIGAKPPVNDFRAAHPPIKPDQPRTGIIGNDMKFVPGTKPNHPPNNVAENDLKLVPGVNKFIPSITNNGGQHPGIIGNDMRFMHTNKPLPKPIVPPVNQPVNQNGNQHHHHDDDYHHHGYANYNRNYYNNYNAYYNRPYGYGNYGYGYNSPYYSYGSYSPYFGYGFGYGLARYGIGLSFGGYPSSNYYGYGYSNSSYYPGAGYYDSSVPSYSGIPSYSATPSRIMVSRPVIDPVPPPAAGSAEPTSHEYAAEGETDFKAGRYKEAVRNWQHALVDEPNNGAYLMLLSQGLFAIGEFDAAAGATQQAAQNLPAEHWNVVIKNYKELYTNIQDYTDQLRALEKARTEKPDSPGLRFLLGWHYGHLGYPQQAIAELDKLLEVVPEDEIGKQLREQFVAQLPKDELPIAPVEGKKI